MNTSHLTRLAGRSIVIFTLGAAASGLRAQTPPATPADEPVQLDAYVVTATRTPVSLAELGASASVVTAEERDRRQQTGFAAALGLVPAASYVSTGGAGGATSLFLRGSESDHTLFLVDGIRFSDADAGYNNFLGGARLGAQERIEVVRGPQSTLHGGEAIGGVVAINQVRGCGDASGSLFFEAGTLGSASGGGSVQGARDASSYAFSWAAGHADNERPNNTFDQGNFALRLDHDVSEKVRVGATVRGYQGTIESPGDRFTNDPNDSERERNILATIFTELEPNEDWFVRLTLGAQHRRLVSSRPAPNAFGSPAATDTTVNRRGVFDAQATWSGAESHRVTFGTTTELADTKTNGFGQIDESRELLAFFVQDEITLRENLFFTAGLRSDDHDTFGRATTGRGTLAWLAVPEKLKLRASYGTAFRSPSFIDLYAVDPSFVGNPNLEPEEAKGWDAGFDYTLPAGRGQVSVTWFDIRYDNLIEFFDPDGFGPLPGTMRNVSKARTHGIEFETRLNLGAATELRMAHTWLEAREEGAGTRLLRRPRHTVAADLSHDFGRGFSGGIGATWVVDREDYIAATFTPGDTEDYLTARVYAAWAIRPDLVLKVRVENALDENYEAANGFPSPGLEAFAGMEWRF